MELADLTRGMRKNNFAKLGLSLSFTIAVPKTIFEVAKNCFCVVPGLTPAIPARRVHSIDLSGGVQKNNLSEPETLCLRFTRAVPKNQFFRLRFLFFRNRSPGPTPAPRSQRRERIRRQNSLEARVL